MTKRHLQQLSCDKSSSAPNHARLVPEIGTISPTGTADICVIPKVHNAVKNNINQKGEEKNV